VPSMSFWFFGRFAQVMGLFMLIFHAASFQILPEIEQAGMTMLTAGPVLNIVACSLFSTRNGEDPLYLFNRAWLVTECIELLGISILDLSLIDTEEILVLTFEVVGFAILGCAAILDFDFSVESLSSSSSLVMVTDGGEGGGGRLLGDGEGLVASGYLPQRIGMRLDMVHVSDCFGLLLLTIVGIVQV